MAKKIDIDYIATPTVSRFHLSDAFYRGLLGPVGSGKSTGCCWEIMKRAQEQKPNADGVRRTRWVIVRNTYRELQDTTLQTWRDWFRPDIFGEIKPSTMTHMIKFPLPDKTLVDCEVMFRALDRPDDVKKVLSLEITGAWVNEAREVPKAIIDGLGDRSGRFPAIKDGGCTWRGVFMDTNPPDEDHWWYRLAEEETPPNWEFFRQPGGLIEIRPGEFAPNPKAENIDNLEPDYYLTRSYGKSPEYVRIYYCGQYGFVQDGKPVFPEYFDAVHCSQDLIQPAKGIPIYVGLDFGLTPAAVFEQRLPNGKWIWFDELVSDDMGISRFADVLGPKLRGEYKDFDIKIWGDPAGNIRGQTDETTCYQILEVKGIKANPTATNDFTLRREALAVTLSRMIDGKPGFQISPKCKMTRKGLAGGYCFRRMRISGEERFHDTPDKNQFSHPVEAGCYAMLGAGEGKTLVNIDRPVKLNLKVASRSNLGWMGA